MGNTIDGSISGNRTAPAPSDSNDQSGQNFQAELLKQTSGKAQSDAANDLANLGHSGSSTPSWSYSSLAQLTPQQQNLYDQAQKKSGSVQNMSRQAQAGDAQPSKGWAEKLVDRMQSGADAVKGEVRKGVELADAYTPKAVKDGLNDLNGTVTERFNDLKGAASKRINDGVAMIQEHTPQVVKDALNAGLEKAKDWQRDVDDAKDRFGGKVEQAEKAVSERVNDTRKWLSENGGTTGQQASDIIGFGAGFAGAVYDFGKGTVKMADGAVSLASPLEWEANPERNQQRLQGLKNGVEGLDHIAALASPTAWALNPKENFQFSNALGNGIEDGVSKAWHDDPAKALGYGVGTLATFVVPVGAGAKAATGAKDAAEIGSAASQLARGSTEAANLGNDVATLGKGGAEVATAGRAGRLREGAEVAVGLDRTEHVGAENRLLDKTLEKSPPWVREASNHVKGAVFIQKGDTCVSATGEILTNGAITKEALAEAIGRPANPLGLAKQLNKLEPGAWRGGYVNEGSDAVRQAQRGTMGLEVNAANQQAHMVTISPIAESPGKFRVLDTAIGYSYDVTSDWIEKFANGGVWRTR